MNCQESGRWISLQIDGDELPAERTAELTAHLEECPACREVRDAEARLASRIGALLTARSAEALPAARRWWGEAVARSRLSLEPADRRRLRALVGASLVGAAAAAAVFIAILWRGGEMPSPLPTPTSSQLAGVAGESSRATEGARSSSGPRASGAEPAEGAPRVIVELEAQDASPVSSSGAEGWWRGDYREGRFHLPLRAAGSEGEEARSTAGASSFGDRIWGVESASTRYLRWASSPYH